MSIIIVEGPDGAGKTTYIERFMKSHPGAEMAHFSAPKTDAEDRNYWRLYADLINRGWHNRTLILDRSWYSNMIYQPIYERPQYIDKAMQQLLEASCIANGGAFILYLTAPLKVLWKRCGVRGETFVTSSEILERISNGYKALFDDITNTSIPVLRIDTSYNQ